MDAGRHGIDRPEPGVTAGRAPLAGIGAWGVSLMPKSGFWLFFPVAALAAVRTRAGRVRG
jgi:hypothetical protein